MYRNVQEDVVTGLPLAINIFIKLRDDILRGKLKNEEKLTEQRICDEYNVSRTPVREAFRLLEQEGLIKMVPNRGAFVTGFTDRDIADMYDMRKVYERLAMEWAVERITEEQLQQIRDAFELIEFYTQKKEYEKVREENTYFHELIYKASQNRLLSGILASYQYYTKRLKIGETLNSSNIDLLLEEHRNLLNALETRDKEAGIAAVQKHLEGSKKRAGY